MKLSIVTPSYKQLDKLALCIASIADQVSSSPGLTIEHIVQDPGTPGLENLARASDADFYQDQALVFSSSKPLSASYRLLIHNERDSGMYDAINRGLRKSSGEVCSWLNCDEQYLLGALTAVAHAFEDNPKISIFFGDAILLGPRYEILSYRQSILPRRTHLRLNHLNVPSCGMFFRRGIVETGHYFDESWKTIGDAVWIEALLREDFTMAVLNQATSTFQFTGNNLGNSETARIEAERWSRMHGAPQKWLRYPTKLSHWLRKWAAGAYRKRKISVSVYTEAELFQRKELPMSVVGSHWPS